MWLEPDVRIHAPEVGRTWINCPGLTLRELRGRVVLIDFWDYTCVNCIRTLPYVGEWHRRYARHGLTVIGVHAPEFDFARSAENVSRAVRQFGLEYPVVLDNGYEIWQAYANRCWPAKYLIDAAGYVRYYHLGEGSYAETEQAIQQLLREIDPNAALPPVMEPLRQADAPGSACYPVTPELYLGFDRGRLGNDGGYVPDKVNLYHAGQASIPDVAYLDGAWFAGRQLIEACPLPGQPSRLFLRCLAAEVNLVMGPGDAKEATLHLRLEDNQALAGVAAEDVESGAQGLFISVREPRMYRLLRDSSVRQRTLELSTTSPGLQAFAFTFVSCARQG
jgi:thiol-disulfide isomerase/thioredoxin